MMYKFNTGDTVRYQPSDERQNAHDALVIGRGVECGEPVYDVILPHGRCWAWEWQLTMIESHAGKVERQVREMCATMTLVKLDDGREVLA